MSVINQVVGLLAGGQRALDFTFKADSLDSDIFKVIDFTVEEGLSAPFLVKLALASHRDNLTESDLVDQNAVLALYRNQVVERYFHGVVFSFTKGNSGRHHTFYEVILVPAFSRLSLRTNARIFQKKSVVEITETLLSEMGIADYALAIRSTHEPREYCVQYAESDLDFIERLCAEEGIFYYFEHEKEKHTVVFADDNSVTDEFPFSCLYNNTEGGLAEAGCIRSLAHKAKMTPTDAVLKDYSFKQPSNSFLSQARGIDTDYQKSYEHYMYPGRFKDDAVGQSFSKTRVDYLRSDAKIIEGQGDIAQMISGYVMKVTDHPSIGEGDKWLVTHVKHEGTQPQSLDNEGSEGQTTYHNRFSALPFAQQWKPKPEVKPHIYGPQIATVVGPSSEEIYTDEFGRIKVQFPWDREGQSDENSSCWVRVAQVGAGAGFGNIVIPRIGHEVIVSFLEGDPDQPIVTGSTFHATNRSSLDLPAAKTQMAFRGKTHDGSGTGSGYNELSFENDKDRQMVHIHAQKDMSTKVLNDRDTDVTNNHTEKIGKNQSIEVGKDQVVDVIKDQQIAVGKNQLVSVTKDQTIIVDKNQSISVNKDQTSTVKKNASHTVLGGHALGVGQGAPDVEAGTSIISTAKDIKLSAGRDIVLTNGKASITLYKNGDIAINGKLVDVAGSNKIQLNCSEEG